MGLALLSLLFLTRVTILQPRSLLAQCCLGSLHPQSNLPDRRPLVVSSLGPSPTPLLSLPQHSCCSSPPARLYQEALKSFLHTRYFCTITLSFLSPFPLHLLPAFALPRGQLGKIWGPRTHAHPEADLWLWDTRTGPLGEGQKASLPAPSTLHPCQRACRGQPLAHWKLELAG